MLFPLPTVPFEQSLLVDDRPAYPWNILIRLQFEGSLNPTVLQTALQRAIERHPLLGAKVVRRRFSWDWVPAEPFVPKIQWHDMAEGKWPQLTHLNLLQRGPLEVWGRTGKAAELHLHLHHANVDGKGMLQFLGDWLTIYANELGAGYPLPEYQPALLRLRQRYGLSPLKLLHLVPKLARGFTGAWEFASRVPATLTPYDPVSYDSPFPQQYPAVLSHEFTQAETAAIAQAARNQSGTINDLLARDLFLTLGAWRESRQLVDDEAWLRMMIPINLRRPDDQQLPAANIMSTIFLDRRRTDLNDPLLLLKSITKEMELIKRNQLGLIWVLGLRLLAMIPGQLERMGSSQGPVATTILTNLMRLFEELPLPRQEHKLIVAGAWLKKVEIFAPLRPWTCATFAIMTYGQRLQLSYQYDPRVLQPADGRELLSRYVSQVQASCRCAAKL